MKLVILVILLTAAAGLAEAKSLQLKDLPAAVQKTVRNQTAESDIKSISQEKENGVAQFEVETIRAGKHRDFNVDTSGTLLSVEEEVSIDSIPAPAKAAILNKAAKSKLLMVEAVTENNTTTYEASVRAAGGKKHEFAVKADGTPAK